MWLTAAPPHRYVSHRYLPTARNLYNFGRSANWFSLAINDFTLNNFSCYSLAAFTASTSSTIYFLLLLFSVCFFFFSGNLSFDALHLILDVDAAVTVCLQHSTQYVGICDIHIVVAFVVVFHTKFAQQMNEVSFHTFQCRNQEKFQFRLFIWSISHFLIKYFSLSDMVLIIATQYTLPAKP